VSLNPIHINNKNITFIGPIIGPRNKKKYFDIAGDAEKYEKRINKMRAEAGLPPADWDYEFERNINDLMT